MQFMVNVLYINNYALDWMVPTWDKIQRCINIAKMKL